MDFSGTLNWGDVVAQIVLHDVEFAGDGGTTITQADVEFNINGESTNYHIAPM